MNEEVESGIEHWKRVGGFDILGVGLCIEMELWWKSQRGAHWISKQT